MRYTAEPSDEIKDAKILNSQLTFCMKLFVLATATTDVRSHLLLIVSIILVCC